MTNAPLPFPTPPPGPAGMPALPAPSGNRRGIIPNAPPPDILRDDSIDFLFQFIRSNAQNRGPFRLKKEDTNQMLPGLSLPAWMMQGLSTLAGRPELPYMHDRPALVRDLLMMGMTAYVQVLSEYASDAQMRNITHIIRQEMQLRHALYIEETMLQYVEDFAVVAQLLDLKIRSGSHEAVFEQLQQVFHHAEQIQDRVFWRPTITRLLFAVPEVVQALDFVGERERYRLSDDYQAWRAIQEGI